MSLSVPVLLSVELGTSPATLAGVRFDRAEAAAMTEMDGWYADETHSLFWLAKNLQEDAVPPPRVRGRWNVTVHVALLVVPLRTRLAMITPSSSTS